MVHSLYVLCSIYRKQQKLNGTRVSQFNSYCDNFGKTFAILLPQLYQQHHCLFHSHMSGFKYEAEVEEYDTCVRGFYVYQDVWMPWPVIEELRCQKTM